MKSDYRTDVSELIQRSSIAVARMCASTIVKKKFHRNSNYSLGVSQHFEAE